MCVLVLFSYMVNNECGKKGGQVTSKNNAIHHQIKGKHNSILKQ